MSGADGRSSPHSLDIPQPPILTSFFDILIPLQSQLVVQNSQYVRDRDLFCTMSNTEFYSISRGMSS